ncbi:hypothetical protein KPL74_16530 [Bacillus sp. NP157]|nr:hypothetical protein KPL74_16530 [Bacillus sp. NP157]
MMRNALHAVALLAVLGATATASAKNYELSFKGMDVHPGDRVVGFDIKGANLILDQVVHFPNGWSFKIETDPAGNTEISGAIIVGAAALSPSEVEHGWMFRDPPGESDGPAVLSGTISVTKTFDDVREIPLDSKMLVVKSRK